MATDVITLDACQWQSIADFIDTLLKTIGAPAWHGRSINAFKDSMIIGDINQRKPPYTIRITGTDQLPADVRLYISDLSGVLADARVWKRDHYGEDAEVVLEMK